ncbi:cation:proton antiporter regulatory subunit [Sulfurihydrogenibium subterraneum]|uniref:cation:proton antiporter regulatory subunit n=1 Tax=Sulfurihydrogenibium subterraneum TaxID=171121 RepID=UPI00048D28B7|nr:cation:proton antiporter regulatory subunit [Sulfurihydrogenibium subterraneum]
MLFKETDLPGIGKKFSVITANKEKVAVIIHISGKREIYFFNKDDYDEPMCSFSLNEEEATQLGSILMGTYFKPEAREEKEMFMKNLVIEWVNVEPSSVLANKSIKELEIRKKTGASVIAIIRNNETITNPSPDEIIKPGDTLIVVGNKDQIKKFFEVFYPVCEIK